VNQFLIALAAQVLVLMVAFVLVWKSRTRSRSESEPGSQAHRAAFEQSPNSMLIVDADTLKVIDANAASHRNLGYSLEQIRALSLEQLFTDEGCDQETLGRGLRDPSSRLPLEIQQRAKDGSLRSVEVSVQRLELGPRRLLSLTAHDVSVRRKVQAQLLEKQ